MLKPGLMFVFSSVLLLACGSPAGHSQQQNGALTPIPCGVTADCIDRGGTCVSGVCHASNECAKDADCKAGQTCVSDAAFRGLCAKAGAPVVAGPAWSCSVGQDCPTGQGCGSDGTCHSDGECQADADCASGSICYNGESDLTAGFCDLGRTPQNPYCRSDGHGACRSKCANAAGCGSFGATCNAGFCHDAAECQVSTDCSPNHVCEAYFDQGYSVCGDDPNPTCVTDPAGACRLACKSGADCTQGGGCSSDGLCHASNECKADSDCATGEICYPSATWGGLCGVPR